MVVASQPTVRQPARVVDPMVEEEPLFPAHYAEERRPQKGGFFSLFGSRPRYDAPPAREAAPPAPKAQAPQAIPKARTTQAVQPIEEEAAEPGEDLEIPSFLRRLAN